MAFNPDLQRAAARLARRAKNGSSSIWTPGQPVLDLHLGSIGAVNTFHGTAEFNWADGSDTNVLRYMQAYGADHVPEEGHDAWVLQYGTDYLIIGRHTSPDSPVTPS